MDSGIMDMIGKVLGSDCDHANYQEADEATKQAIHKDLAETHKNSDFAHMALEEAMPFLKKELGDIAVKHGISSEGAIGAVCSMIGIGK